MEQKGKKQLLILVVLLSILGAGGLFTAGSAPVRNVDALRLFASGALFGIFLSTLFALIRSRNRPGAQ